MKDKLKSILNKIKNNKKKVIGITFGVFAVFIFTFATYNLNNPTYFNRLFANVLNNGVPANSNFEDNTFYSCVVDAYNSANGTSKAYTDNLTDEELASITSLECSGWRYSDSDKITSAKGVEKLTGLTTLHLYENKLTSIDIGKNTFLTNLELNSNQLTSIDLSNNTALSSLNLNNNQLTSIDLNKNTKLESLHLNSNQLTSIDVSNNTSLTELNLGFNQLTTIDVSGNTSLIGLNLDNNQLTSIDVSKNVSLTNLSLSYNQLASIDVSKNVSLINLSLGSNQLTNIDLRGNTSLTYLNLASNQLTSIDVSKNTSLINLSLGYNQLTSIDVSNNTALTNLDLYSNQLTGIGVSNNTSLTELDLSFNQLTSIDLSKNTTLIRLGLSGNQLTNIDVSNNTALTDLGLADNKLTSIDVSNNTSLTTLNLYSNQLTNIDLSNNTSLTRLFLDNNSFEDIPTMTVGETYVIKDNIKLPNDKKATYSIKDTSIAKLENGVITALKNGTTRLIIDAGYTSEYNEDYKIYIDFMVQSAELSSNLYNINNDLKYIYTKNITDTNTILSNISTSIGEIQTDDDNTLKIKYNDKIISEYKIISYNVTDYDTDGEYIYPIINKFDYNNISVINGSYEVDNNQNVINIKYEDNIIDTVKLVILTSSKYDLTKWRKDTYPYTTNHYILLSKPTDEYRGGSEISVTNASLWAGSLYDDMYVDADGKSLFSFSQLKMSINNGSFGEDYVYTKNETNLDNIKANITRNYGTIDIEDNMLKVLYNNEVLLEYKIVNFKIKNAVISGNTINAIKDKFSINDIEVNNGMYKLNDDNTLNIKYNDQVIDTLNIEIITPSLHFIDSTNNYIINDKEKYIYTRNSFRVKYMIENLVANIGNVVIEDNKAKIVYDGETLLEYKFVRYNIKNYTLTKYNDNYYLNIGNNVLDESYISVINGDYEISDNNLVIKYNNKTIDTIPIISYQLDYDIINSYGNKYIYLKDKEFDSSKITVNNCEYKIEYNQLTIYSPTTILETINLASINLNGAELKGSSVYLGGMGNLYINGTNCDVNDLGNYIYQIIIGENIVDTISGIKIEASDWSIIERIDNYGYIYLGARSISELADFNIINGYSEETENELIIYESENKEYELKRLNILRISSDKYDLKSSYSKDNNAYYIYTKDKKIDASSIKASDGIIIDDQTSYIAIRDSISGMDLESIQPVYVDVNKYSEYKLVDDCIYLGLINKNDSQYISVNGGYAQKNGDQFDIYSGAGQKLDSLDIIALETDYLSYDVKDESESRSRYEYEFASSSLYLGVDTFNPAYITSKINSTYEYATDTSLLKIKHNDKLIEEIKVVNIYLPDKYKFIWDNLYLKDSEFKDSMVKSITNVKNIDKDKISVMNGKLILVREEQEDDDGNTYFEEWLDVYTIDYDSSRYEDEDYRDSKYIKGEIALASISSKKYDMSDNYIYLGTEDFNSDLEFKNFGKTYNTNKLLETNALKIDKNKIELWFTGEECDSKYVDGKYVETCSYEPVEKVDSWDLVKVLSDDFDLSTSSIDLNFDGIFSLDSVGITSGSISLEGDILVIKYKDKVVKEIKVNDAKKNTTTTKKVEDIENTTQNSSYTTTTKKRNIFSRLFGNKKTTATAKKVTSRKNIFRRTTKNKSSTTKVITNKNNISTTNKESGKTIRLNVKILVILLVSFNIIFVSALYLFKKDKFKEKGEK